MIKKYPVFLVFFSLPFCSWAQEVFPVTIDQLNERISNGADTVYVVNFWATWCKPCIKELPYFMRLDSAYGNEKLQVLLVSVDLPSQLEKAVKPFIKRIKLNKEAFFITDKDQQAFINKVDTNWSGAIPATLFVKGEKRTFAEQAFTYPELLRHYQNIKQ